MEGREAGGVGLFGASGALEGLGCASVSAGRGRGGFLRVRREPEQEYGGGLGDWGKCGGIGGGIFGGRGVTVNFVVVMGGKTENLTSEEREGGWMSKFWNLALFSIL